MSEPTFYFLKTNLFLLVGDISRKVKSVWHFIELGLHVFIGIGIFFKIMPNEWNINGVLWFVFISISLIIALISNLINTITYRNDVKAKDESFKKQVDQYEAKLLKLENELCENERFARYSKFFPHLNKAFSEMHNTVRAENLDVTLHKDAFKEFCTKLSQIFTTVKGVECHVCIKIISIEGKNNNKIDKLLATTFVRDLLILNRDSIDDMKIKHQISNNTDFKYIFNNINSEKGRYFFSNNLAAIPYYRNTSFLKKIQDLSSLDNLSLEEKEKKWPLEYFSTINAPICPGITSQRSNSTLLGFLCIDSKQKDVFNENVDAEIISGCADGLYNSLVIFKENLEKQKKLNHEKKSS